MTAPAKPQPLRPQWEGIPTALRDAPSWVLWRYEWRKDKKGAGKWTKPPHRAVGKGYAKTDDPGTWSDFHAARQAADSADGVGIVLTEDLVGVDLDHVVDEHGDIQPWAAEVIERFRGCYVERSPGGDGIRIFCRGVARHSGKGGPENRCEVYDKSSPRYLTVTGCKLVDGEVIEAQAALDWLHVTHMQKPAQKATEGPTGAHSAVGDDEVLRMAAKARNGPKFSRLFAGDAGDDPSTADAALIGILSFWTQDPAQLDRLFRRSGLMRPKWDEQRGDQTYGELTIKTVLGMGGERFKPGHQHGGQGDEHVEDWPELNPLPEPVETEPQAFPHHALGKLLGDAAKAIAEGVQAPDALAAGSVLASAALVAQAHADVVMPHGRRAPLSVFVVTGALSGDRKTATDDVACLPAEEYRQQQARAHAVALQQYEQDRAARQKGDPEVAQPVARSLTVGKTTVEGLHMMLGNQSHIGVFTGEGGELFGGHSMRDDRRTAGLAWYLKAWGAETLDDLTRGKGFSMLLGRRVAMHAMVQPVLLRSLLADPLAQGQGFLARCLVSEPGTLAGTRLFKAGNPAEHPAVKAYHTALRDLLAKKPSVHPTGDGHELQPRQLRMSDDATALWIEFYNQVETEQLAGAKLQGARAFASKGAEHAARIAGIISLINGHGEVTLEAMAGAIQVAVFYISEHVRLTGAGVEDRQAFLLRTLAAWISEQGRATQKHILQSAPRPIRDLKAAGINPLLDELAQRGYIRRSGDAWEGRP